VARDFIAHVVDFVHAVTGPQGSTSVASLLLPSVALPPSMSAHIQQQQQQQQQQLSLRPLRLPPIPQSQRVNANVH